MFRNEIGHCYNGNFCKQKLNDLNLDKEQTFFLDIYGQLNSYNDKNTKLADIPKENIGIQLKMILNVSDKERIKKLIIPLLRNYLEEEYENHKTLLRKAISYVDKVLYFDQIVNF